jgi:hypothetical protein
LGDEQFGPGQVQHDGVTLILGNPHMGTHSIGRAQQAEHTIREGG